MSQSVIYHPCLDENGKLVVIVRPSESTNKETWTDAKATAILSRTDEHEIPASLNGIAFNEHLQIDEDPWKWLERVPDFLPDEPDFVMPPGFRATSGCVVLEPDGRIWVVFPSNQYAGVECTFPKGRLEPILSLVQNAVKETWEEAGLLVKPVAFLTDVTRTKFVTRFYIAKRIDGSPNLAGWESQAVGLMPADKLPDYINRTNDRKVFEPLAKWLEENADKLAQL
ncbi:MAG: NUDIX hydrolase [Sutterellaceae bacterium]|nr:NUDIX hydrolase [Sutterellaceae bacterium]